MTYLGLSRSEKCRVKSRIVGQVGQVGQVRPVRQVRQLRQLPTPPPTNSASFPINKNNLLCNKYCKILDVNQVKMYKTTF